MLVEIDKKCDGDQRSSIPHVVDHFSDLFTGE